jgi:squalene synthase HpnC
MAMNVAAEGTGKGAEALLLRALGGFTQEPAATEAGTPELAPPSREELLARGWAALPESYRIPDVAPTLEEAQAWCKHLAETHYENFHVATWFLPRALRTHFHAIYAYCRVSDDLGDEVGNTAVALALLEQWGEELDACYAGQARHPVFVALAETIRECSIPKEPFADLLVAFRQDQTVTRYATMEDVLEYCRYSANPVGRLVLYASGEADEEKFRLSDATCSALQLANFWQDVREDWARGRVYLPQKDMEFYRVSDTIIGERTATPEFRALMHCEVNYARDLFEQGLPLIGMVNRHLALDLDLFSRGGLEILRAIERRDFDVLSARSAISKATKASLALRAATARLLPFLKLGRSGRRPEPAD